MTRDQFKDLASIVASAGQSFVIVHTGGMIRVWDVPNIDNEFWFVANKWVAEIATREDGFHPVGSVRTKPNTAHIAYSEVVGIYQV